MAHHDLPRPSVHVAHRTVEGESVLVHLETNRIYSLNETGARFWQLLAEGLSRREIEDRLLQEFDVSASDLRHEMQALLVRLEAEELVV